MNFRHFTEKFINTESVILVMSHEELLRTVLEKLREAGLYVVRLDGREIPDAFIVVNNKPIAIEIEMDGSPKYSRNSQFDGIITIGPMKKYYHDHKPKTYLKVIQLRKEGTSYPKIKEYMETVANVKLSLSTIHDWCRGKSRPRTIHIT